MNKLILSAAIAAVLCTNVAIADDDNGNPILGTTSSTQVVNTVTNDTVNTVNNSLASRNANRNVNDNTNVSDNTNVNNNSLSQGQTQEQDQNQQQNARATSTATSESHGGNATSSALGGNATGGTASANGNGSGNATNINQSYSDVYRERLNPVSSAIGTNLTAGADTCLGSVTGGVQTQILGLSGGKTVVDENCVMIKNTKLLLTMGLPSAACFYVRQDPKIDEAMAAAGVECKVPPPVLTEDVPVPSDPPTKQ